MTDAAKMIVEEKMDKLSAVYKEALDRLKGLSSQLTNLPAAELKKKVDQIVGLYFLPFKSSDIRRFSLTITNIRNTCHDDLFKMYI